MNHLSLSSRVSVLALAGAAIFLSGCHDKVIVVPTPPAAQTAQPAPQTNTIVVHDAPPPPRDDSMPSEPPPPDKTWEKGHWEYRDNNYTWVAGHWIDKQPNAEYVSPHWGKSLRRLGLRRGLLAVSAARK